MLVHGGGHGAWCWAPLIPELESAAMAVDLPPQSIRGGPLRNTRPPELGALRLEDWSTHVLEEADRAEWGRFVLVGHSMGGLTIADAARRAPERVAHMVYVSASVPPEGGTVMDMLPADVSQDVASGLEDDLMRTMFCNDLDEAQARYVLGNIGIEAEQIVTEPVTRAGIPKSLPTTYVRLARDQALPPNVQDACIDRLRGSVSALEIVTMDAGHDAMVGHPRELAGILDAIARSSR